MSHQVFMTAAPVGRMLLSRISTCSWTSVGPRTGCVPCRVPSGCFFERMHVGGWMTWRQSSSKLEELEGSEQPGRASALGGVLSLTYAVKLSLADSELRLPAPSLCSHRFFYGCFTKKRPVPVLRRAQIS